MVGKREHEPLLSSASLPLDFNPLKAVFCYGLVTGEQGLVLPVAELKHLEQVLICRQTVLLKYRGLFPILSQTKLIRRHLRRVIVVTPKDATSLMPLSCTHLLFWKYPKLKDTIKSISQYFCSSVHSHWTVLCKISRLCPKHTHTEWVMVLIAPGCFCFVLDGAFAINSSVYFGPYTWCIMAHSIPLGWNSGPLIL